MDNLKHYSDEAMKEEHEKRPTGSSAIFLTILKEWAARPEEDAYDLEWEKAEDQIHDWFDGRFLIDKFDECNEVLPLIDVSDFPSCVCMTLLCVTKPAAEELSNRPALVERIRELFTQRVGSERTANLLRSLG